MQVFTLLTAVLCFTACDEDTATIGIVSDTDIIKSYAQGYSFTTRSVAMDSVTASSAYSYLGQITDPETGSVVKAEFVAQFHTSENYSLPNVSSIVKNEEGKIVADSVEVRLYFSSYYGDDNNPMRLAIYELDPERQLDETATYYSDVDLSDFVAEDAAPLTYKVFTPSDYSLDESERTSTSHYDNVNIKLPTEFGTRILNAAIEHPEYFADSWQFTHHVLPGLYFQLKGGMGTMLKLDVSALNVHFRYVDNDSVYNGIARFSATEEVIQSTSFDNTGLDEMLNEKGDYTYLKTPAGIATEITLPVDEVFEGHERDSVSRARLILTRYNAQTEHPWGTPSTLLMVKKGARHSFFANHQLTDNVTSYVTSFESSYNTYTYANIARLLSHLFHEKQDGMRTEGLTSAEWNAKYPDWNKVVVMPVAVTTTSNSSTGVSTQVAVLHDYSLTSIRLVGGSQVQQMQVVYSTYQ